MSSEEVKVDSDEEQLNNNNNQDGDEAQRSALSHNIHVKGKNSYYYAWKKDALNNDPNAKPSKVGTETITVSKHIALISNYSYCDENSKCSVYVPLENVDPSTVKCTFTPTSFDLIINGDDTDKRLSMDVYGDILPDTSKYLVKKDKLVIICRKLKEESWSDLKKSTK